MKKLIILLFFAPILLYGQEYKSAFIKLDSTVTHALIKVPQVDTVKVLIIGSPCNGCCVSVTRGYYVLDYKTLTETYYDENMYPLDWIVCEHKELWWIKE